MFTKLREPFGKAGLTVAIFALVLAMVGGAYAAGALSGKQKKEVEKIAKKFAGKPGAAGANGTNGTNGASGAKGDTGSAGGTGPAGKSVVIGAAAPSCTSGGKTIEVAGEPATKQNVCNGTTGFTETLPSEKTETGTWTITEVARNNVGFATLVPMSFNIPLAAPLDEEHAQFNPPDYPQVDHEQCNPKPEPEKAECNAEVEQREENCPGTSANPTAEPGFLCVYVSFGPDLRGRPVLLLNPEGGGLGAGKGGTIIRTHLEEGSFNYGDFAVTAP